MTCMSSNYWKIVYLHTWIFSTFWWISTIHLAYQYASNQNQFDMWHILNFKVKSNDNFWLVSNEDILHMQFWIVGKIIFMLEYFYLLHFKNEANILTGTLSFWVVQEIVNWQINLFGKKILPSMPISVTNSK